MRIVCLVLLCALPASAAEPIRRLESLRREFEVEDRPFEFIVGGQIESRDDLARWEEAGVSRLIAHPWRRSREALDGLRRYADLVFD